MARFLVGEQGRDTGILVHFLILGTFLLVFSCAQETTGNEQHPGRPPGLGIACPAEDDQLPRKWHKN
jgi:hypothetical protein